MKKPEISIVIPCSDDIRIKDCINSIVSHSKNAEIIVILNQPSKEVDEYVSSLHFVRRYYIHERNLGKARNKGIEKSYSNHILFIDADCTIGKDTIQEFVKDLKSHVLIKGNLKYLRKDFTTRLTGSVREFTSTSTINAFTPMLAFNKSVISRINNYYFHENIRWSEDFELNKRVAKNRVEIKYNHKAVGYHAPISLKEDVKSSFNYGRGRADSEKIGIIQPRNILDRNRMKRVLAKTVNLYKKEGLLASIYYLLLWRSSKLTGYICAKTRYALLSISRNKL